ncbi:hypothetical protein [Goodfellowiella coeruleoviolacea]|uniref:Oxidoreductase n=1 Tax=Goodfellowiella coeruleoviolacea TaxID=334858 RepID=A0AAE3GC80_9PSEU|nr:hypothetical protein [Goodfellowiella coeruleoviolacea]MCP2164592.1 hypothetical protein [Goodfellowiella coeruleoviolacea]
MEQPEPPGTPTDAPADWSEPERLLWAVYRRGGWLDLREKHDDPAQGHEWDESRIIRDVVIERLLLHGPEAHPGHTARLRLAGARITGEVDLSDCRVDTSIILAGCSFEQPLNLTDSELHSAILAYSHLPGLNADHAHLARSLNMRQATCTGEIRLRGAHISGDLDLTGATLINPHGDRTALALDRATINGDLFADKGFTATGQVRLPSAHIGGDLVLVGATLTHPDGVALTLVDAQIARLILRPHRESRGLINLRDARVGRFIDDPRQWPEGCRVDLDGFSYDRLSRLSGDSDPVCSVEERLAWMRAYSTTTQRPSTTSKGRGEFSPTPYEQLAAALRRDGQERQARTVARHREHLHHRALGRLGTLWGIVQLATVGYGYAPARALFWVLGVLGAGSAYFWLAGPLNPIKADEHPTWNPFLYALDLLVPVLDLGHEKAWDPVGADLVVTMTLTVAGWVLVTAFAAGAARTLKRQ